MSVPVALDKPLVWRVARDVYAARDDIMPYPLPWDVLPVFAKPRAVANNIVMSSMITMSVVGVGGALLVPHHIQQIINAATNPVVGFSMMVTGLMGVSVAPIVMSEFSKRKTEKLLEVVQKADFSTNIAKIEQVLENPICTLQDVVMLRDLRRMTFSMIESFEEKREKAAKGIRMPLDSTDYARIVAEQKNVANRVLDLGEKSSLDPDGKIARELRERYKLPHPTVA